MKRVLVLLTVVAMVVAMLAVSVSPAFARGPGTADCIKLFKSQGYSGKQAADLCGGGR